jgi:hypothetical protein
LRANEGLNHRHRILPINRQRNKREGNTCPILADPGSLSEGRAESGSPRGSILLSGRRSCPSSARPWCEK